MPGDNKIFESGAVDKEYSVAQAQIPIHGAYDKYLLVKLIKGEDTQDE